MASVEFTAAHLLAFARRWPCFGEPDGPLTASFDVDGNLCDIAGDEGLEPGGVLALCHDAAYLAGLGCDEEGPPSLDYLDGLPWPEIVSA